MLDIDAIVRAPLVRDPFDHFIAHGVVPPESMGSVISDAPAVTSTGSVPLAGLPYGPAFERLVEDLKSREFSAAVGVHFALPDLPERAQLITFRARAGAKDGSVHTDSEWKIVTVLLYLNPDWGDPGGRLRLLRSNDVEDVAVEIPPDYGTLLAFRRSDRSFHGHRPFVGERRLLQVNWVTDAAYVTREERRHRGSALLKKWLRFGASS